MTVRPWLALVLVAALVLQACGSADRDPIPTASTAPSTSATDPAPSSAAPSSAAPDASSASAVSWTQQLADLGVPCTQTASADGLGVQVCQAARDAASNRLPVLTAYVLTSTRGIESFALLATPWYDQRSQAGAAKLTEYDPWRTKVWTVLAQAALPEDDQLGVAEMTGMRKTEFGLFGRNPFLSLGMSEQTPPQTDRGVWFVARQDAAKLPTSLALDPNPSALADYLDHTGTVAGFCQLPMQCQLRLTDGVPVNLSFGGETGWFGQLAVHGDELSNGGASSTKLAVASEALLRGYLPATTRAGSKAAAASLVVNRYGSDRVVVGAVELSAEPNQVAFTSLSEYLAPRVTPSAREWATAARFVKAYTNAAASREACNADLAALLTSNSTTKPASLRRLPGQASPVMVTHVQILEGEPTWTIDFSLSGDQKVTARLVGDKLLSITED